ncbi:allophanate hydrolase [Paenibacillus pasadenensis]|uniref:Allophanate hydrolase n=1 Tax=Paenibacillus pasadenensis TaxID=217090 RepID=A0A2N5NAU7_9BACL|nr:allophanate hydrolase [Paenibacillus pasadenensis]PLT47448.1 Allophanate hydrolase [Paenibacillus pasadenensis]
MSRAWTIASLREAYRSGRTTPEEVMRELCEKAAAEASWNIWITPPTMERLRPCLRRLEELDPDACPLWGIPFAVKDNIDVAGMLTTAACPDYAYAPVEHAAVVRRLVEAGAVPIGKTNLDQFATGLVGTRSPYGETANALRPELISGGSSSGSAVAVARGHAVFALGTDTAGSGRVPAALNGIAGYKAAPGAWPTRGVVPACASLDCVSVFAADWTETAEIDRIARGLEPGDPWSAARPAPEPALPSELLLPDDPLAFFGPFAAEYEEAWKVAERRLGSLGLPVRRIRLQPLEEAAALLYEGPYVEERRASLGGFLDRHPGSALPVTESVLRSGEERGYDAAALFRALHRLQELRLESSQLLRGAVLALPTAGGTWTREQVGADPLGANSAMGRWTNHCNLLGLGALALPAGAAARELPFGITLFAAADEEGLLFGAAAAFDERESTATVPDAAGSQKLAQAAAFAGISPPASPDAAGSFQPAAPSAEEPASAPEAVIAVCGLHMRGMPLEPQMLGHGARFLREARTAPCYRLLRLPGEPAKPGLVRVEAGGSPIALELWSMPLSRLGAFVEAIPQPLGFGKVRLEDGSLVSGFLCEGVLLERAEDISASGGWRTALEQAAR